MDNDTLLSGLLQKYLDGMLSEKERRLFAVLLEQDPDNPAIEALLRESYANSGAGLGWTNKTRQLFVNQMMQRIIGNNDEPNVSVRRMYVLRRLGWAAVLLLMLGSGTYIWWQTRQKTLSTIAQAALENDVPPGKTGAILTLENGQQVVLDNLGNGVIAFQGNKTVKLNDGKVKYDNNGNAVAAAIVYNTLSTPKGRQFQLVLPDGSKVWLNAGSSLTFPTAFSGGERKVSVTGEAYFEVAHNPQSPFRVQINDHSSVEVLGTHFNINAYADEPNITTTLLEGRVNVKNGNKNEILAPGQQAQLNGNNIRVVPDADMDEAVAWKEGKFLFKDASLQAIMRQISRWYDLDIVYNGAPQNDTFNGIIDRRANLSRILKILERGGVRFKIQENRLIVTP